MLRQLMAGLLFLSPVVLADTRVIELQSAAPESLVPVVKPLLGPWESVSVFRQSLVVNAAPETLDRVESLVRELDRPLRNLRISLRRASSDESGIDTRDASVTSTRAREEVQEIRTLEATPLLLRDGSLVPLPAGGVFGPEILWESLENGFAVTARVSGETVTVDVEVRDDNLRSGTVRKTTLQSSVSGQLGEWIALGSTKNTSNRSSLSSGADISTRKRASGSYELLVELLP
jgi:hypothetical protein